MLIYMHIFYYFQKAVCLGKKNLPCIDLILLFKIDFNLKKTIKDCIKEILYFLLMALLRHKKI